MDLCVLSKYDFVSFTELAIKFVVYETKWAQTRQNWQTVQRESY